LATQAPYQAHRQSLGVSKRERLAVLSAYYALFWLGMFDDDKSPYKSGCKFPKLIRAEDTRWAAPNAPSSLGESV